MTEEANEKKSYADSEAVGLTWNRDTGIECYQEEYLLKVWIKPYVLVGPSRKLRQVPSERSLK